ncbi:MAG: ABC transporter ATP-binding protein [Epsilonproteobacteria bacterium]|nr:ABC transporter ATP-binding protein [Campylobacterota bacterium]
MIELKNVTKIYHTQGGEQVDALLGIDLVIPSGSVVVLRGESGSGKSTLLSLIAALSKPTSGEVIVDERQISKLPDNFASIYRGENIGFVFQRYNLIPSLSVAENIIVPLIPHNLERKIIEEKLMRVMKLFSIEHKESAVVRNLSGGEQQRVAIARACVNDPKIILADEPTANLDAALSRNFLEILRVLKSQGKTIVIATHDPIFFDQDFVDAFYEVKKGRIV